MEGSLMELAEMHFIPLLLLLLLPLSLSPASL
jgi:hypothetical protein